MGWGQQFCYGWGIVPFSAMRRELPLETAATNATAVVGVAEARNVRPLFVYFDNCCCCCHGHLGQCCEHAHDEKGEANSGLFHWWCRVLAKAINCALLQALAVMEAKNPTHACGRRNPGGFSENQGHRFVERSEYMCNAKSVKWNHK